MVCVAQNRRVYGIVLYLCYDVGMERFKYDPQVQVFLQVAQKSLCESGDARFDQLDFSRVLTPAPRPGFWGGVRDVWDAFVHGFRYG